MRMLDTSGFLTSFVPKSPDINLPKNNGKPFAQMASGFGSWFTPRRMVAQFIDRIILK